ncbi:hypothetical protein N7468_010506 [Penicillium chermesinum]|uniref:Uncharacterized protein n=1 Tax=Penicillium chermesinum TaxID=63820 RepID=A0A9W9N7S0_9EURO|nr:uncharacterized protein N7468_010506 [Penicillium chermesinum]KAJ5214827.1 hypothetical protein N7468_010506 [Penicillium chermesinum]KAJ6141669.1 hypothetical protein N7470_010059 [Penicillium chermesinum]
MTRKAQVAIVTLSTLIIYVSLNSLARALDPSAFVWYEEDWEERSWIATSRFWLDRKACRWLSICGLAHLQKAHSPFGHRDPASWTSLDEPDAEPDAEPGLWSSFWTSGANQSEWAAEERSKREIPDYVFEYAPLVHLYSQEQFWPSDIAEHLYHTTPSLNYTPIQADGGRLTLNDLDRLNEFNGRHVFLTSNDNVESRPPWLEGEANIPKNDREKDPVDEMRPGWDEQPDPTDPGDAEDTDDWTDLRDEQTRVEQEREQARLWDQARKRFRQELRKRYGGKKPQEPLAGSPGGRSDAPAVLLTIDKGNGVVDAFWFFFYSFNLGNAVFNIRFGNHVGDWEHCLVRFHHGKPKALFFSAHTAGEAYRYEAVEKIGRRPVIYSAEGSHAMYATAGIHPYILPWGLLYDVTDKGPLWDPLLNSHTYTYDGQEKTLRASTVTPNAPTEWFYFRGHWGDKFYPLGDTRQYRFAGQYHYVNGPLGPRFKRLNRNKMCQGSDWSPCLIRDSI